jgi:hypothetical protein
MIELIVYGSVPQSRQSIMTVVQWHKNQMIRGPLFRAQVRSLVT